MTSPVGWVLMVAAAVYCKRNGHTAEAIFLGFLAMVDAVVTAFKWMGYGK